MGTRVINSSMSPSSLSMYQLYKLERILMLKGDLNSASNFKEFFFIKFVFLYNSLSKSGITILVNSF